jgi:hypothetical protein
MFRSDPFQFLFVLSSHVRATAPHSLREWLQISNDCAETPGKLCLLQYYDPSKEPPYFDKNLDYGNKHGQLVWLSTIERFIKLLQYVKDVLTLSLRESTLLFN